MAIVVNPLSTPALQRLKPSDLEDQNLSVLNLQLQTIWQHIVTLHGGAGNVHIKAPIIAADLQIPSQTLPPTHPDSVLTLRSAMSLFSPDNIRKALVDGAFPTGPTAVRAGQPIPKP